MRCRVFRAVRLWGTGNSLGAGAVSPPPSSFLRAIEWRCTRGVGDSGLKDCSGGEEWRSQGSHLPRPVRPVCLFDVIVERPVRASGCARACVPDLPASAGRTACAHRAAGIGIRSCSALTPSSHLLRWGRDALNTRTMSLDPSTREPGRRPSDRVARSVDTCSNLRQLYAVDHSARASMKSAASCVN